MSDEIQIGDLLNAIDSGRPPLVIDVRNADEFEHWKIEGRREFPIVHIPYFDFIEDEAAALAKLPKTSNDIVVVCAKGGSSAMVADILRTSGVAARNLVGGMIAYGEYLEPVAVTREIWQFNRRGKGCLSYVIISEDEAVVVDPSRAIDVYETFLKSKNARLNLVLDTHVHADHISGGPALAERNGAKYLAKGRSGSLHDGAQLNVVSVLIRVIETPGHTPESLCYLVADRYLLSGDTLFTQAIGRPDLGGFVNEWSRDLFATLHQRLGLLSEDVLVLPAHYASISEIGSNGVVSASLGDLRRRLPELHIADLNTFAETMRNAVRTPPAEYAEIIKVNLGKTSADLDHMTQWELGKNECAAKGAPKP